LSQLTLNALTAAKEVIVTLQVQFYSYRGLAELIKTIDMVKQYTNPDLIMSGIVCTFYREQRTLNKSIDDMLRDQFGETVFKTKIRENIKLAETPSVGMDIFSYDPNSLGAQDYSALCKEVIDMEEAKRG
jgi:chromosome partitioning protein